MRRLLLMIICLGTIGIPAYGQNCLTDNIGNGWIGVYADAQGTNSCLEVIPFTPVTLHVVATLEGAASAGIVGAEFGIQFHGMTNTSVSFTANPNAGTIIGNPIDSDPANPSNAYGANIAFRNCQLGPRVELGTIQVIVFGPSDAVDVLVTSKVPPSSSDWQAPLFVQCGAEFPRVALTADATELGRIPVTFRGSMNQPECIPCPPPTLHAPLGVYASPAIDFAPLCTPQGQVTTLHLNGRVPDVMPFGVTGASFSVDVADSDGYFFTYHPPANAQAIGNLMDEGLTLLFPACYPPNASPGEPMSLGTLDVVNLNGGPTTLRIRSGPSGGQSCAAYFGCDAPLFSPHCMTPVLEPPDVVYLAILNPSECDGGAFVPETLLLDTHDTANDGDAGPLQTLQQLREGATYSILVEGTLSTTPPASWVSPPAVICGLPKQAPLIPSASVTNHWVGTDAEIHFAVPLPAGGDCEDLPALGFPRQHGRFQVDLGDGFEDLDPVSGVVTEPFPGHAYRYIVTGRDAAARFRWHDPSTADNYGVLRISVEDVIPTDVAPAIVQRPVRVTIHRNWPDPFNPTTRFTFTLQAAAMTSVAIVDVRGQVVRQLRAQTLSAGTHEQTWDGRGDDGVLVPSGVYFARVESTLGTATERLTLIK